MRSAGIAFVVTVGLGFVGVLALGLTRSSALVYSDSVAKAVAVGPIQPGQRACQGPFVLPDDVEFDRVAITIGTYFKQGSAVRVEVVDDRTGRRLGEGRLPAGYPDIAQAPEHVVPVGRVASAEPLRVCFVNEGDGRLAIYGQPTIASPTTNGTVDGKPIPYDFAVELRDGGRSLIALLPTMAERAAVFRAGWVTPLVYLLLGLALLIGAPLLLARGLARAAAARD